MCGEGKEVRRCFGELEGLTWGNSMRVGMNVRATSDNTQRTKTTMTPTTSLKHAHAHTHACLQTYPTKFGHGLVHHEIEVMNPHSQLHILVIRLRPLPTRAIAPATLRTRDRAQLRGTCFVNDCRLSYERGAEKRVWRVSCEWREWSARC